MPAVSPSGTVSRRPSRKPTTSIGSGGSPSSRWSIADLADAAPADPRIRRRGRSCGRRGRAAASVRRAATVEVALERNRASDSASGIDGRPRSSSSSARASSSNCASMPASTNAEGRLHQAAAAGDRGIGDDGDVRRAPPFGVAGRGAGEVFGVEPDRGRAGLAEPVERDPGQRHRPAPRRRSPRGARCGGPAPARAGRAGAPTAGAGAGAGPPAPRASRPACAARRRRARSAASSPARSPCA